MLHLLSTQSEPLETLVPIFSLFLLGLQREEWIYLIFDPTPLSLTFQLSTTGNDTMLEAGAPTRVLRPNIKALFFNSVA